jgi:diguanylate cyclase (GGDEF)-like protein
MSAVEWSGTLVDAALLAVRQYPDTDRAYLLIVGGGTALIIAVCIGAFLLTRQQGDDAATPTVAPPAAPPPAQPSVAAVDARGQQRATDAALREPDTPEPVARLCRAFNEWLQECASLPEIWVSFDQLLREVLLECIGAARVRCYHVRPGSEALQTIAQGYRPTPGEGPLLRDTIQGHVATTGTEFVEDDPRAGAAVHALAAQAEERWAWIWPVHDSGSVLGIVALGHLQEPARLTPALRPALGALMTLCWRHVDCLERFRVVRRTDQGSGLLTRNDFFTLARHALSDSYKTNEPVVVLVLGVEGLRRLDDQGKWQERDRLIERIGATLARHVRAEDLVGRFADDRFVVLLRRLDSGLGKIIAEKLLAACVKCVENLCGEDEGLRVRGGLAGSGLAQTPLEDLLVSAFEALERARKRHRGLDTDLGPAGEAGGS